MSKRIEKARLIGIHQRHACENKVRWDVVMRGVKDGYENGDFSSNTKLISPL